MLPRTSSSRPLSSVRCEALQEVTIHVCINMHMIFHIIGRDEALQKESAKVAELEQLCAHLESEKRALKEASGGAHAAAATAMHYHSTAVQQCALDEEVRDSTRIVYMCVCKNKYIRREDEKERSRASKV